VEGLVTGKELSLVGFIAYSFIPNRKRVNLVRPTPMLNNTTVMIKAGKTIATRLKNGLLDGLQAVF
jgi:hypothetical protein